MWLRLTCLPMRKVRSAQQPVSSTLTLCLDLLGYAYALPASQLADAEPDPEPDPGEEEHHLKLSLTGWGPLISGSLSLFFSLSFCSSYFLKIRYCRICIIKIFASVFGCLKTNLSGLIEIEKLIDAGCGGPRL